MRSQNLFLVFTFLFFSFILDAQKKNVTIELIFYEPYCGGARPTEEMEAEARKPKPYSNRILIIVSNKGKIDTLVTDKNGKLKMKLKKGEYNLFEPWRYYKRSFNSTTLEQFDQECLKNEWNKSIVQINVTGKKTNFIFKNELINYCDWALPCLLETHMPPLRE